MKTNFIRGNENYCVLNNVAKYSLAQIMYHWENEQSQERAYFKCLNNDSEQIFFYIYSPKKATKQWRDKQKNTPGFKFIQKKKHYDETIRLYEALNI
jgi:hypothetical protein